MTELVVGVRLKADGSGLVGELRQMRADLDQLKASAKGAGQAAQELGNAADAASSATAKSAASAKGAAAANEGAAVAAKGNSRALQEFLQLVDPAAAKQNELNRKLAEAEALYRSNQLSQEQLAQVQKRLTDGSAELNSKLGLQRLGWFELGQQAQDVFASYASGTKLTTIAAQQSGQFATALALLGQSQEGSKGKMAAFASFLGGPWGIALGVGVSALSVLIEKLDQTAAAASAAKVGTSGLAEAQGALSEMFDLASGKIKKQNDLLVLNARLTAMNLRVEADKEKTSSQKVLNFDQNGKSGLSTGSQLMSYMAVDTSAPDQTIEQWAVSDLVTRLRAGTVSKQDALAETYHLDFSRLSITKAQLQQAIIDSAASDVKNKMADAIDQSIDSGKLAPELRNYTKPKKPPKSQANALADFGRTSAEQVARINDEYNLAPKDVDRARQAEAELDNIVAKINEKLKDGKGLTDKQRQSFEQTKVAAAGLKPIIEDSLARPIRDMLKDQDREVQIGALRLQGREADASALQLTYQLMSKLGAESEDQLATELAKRGVTGDEIKQLYEHLNVMREQTRELEAQKEAQQAWLGAIDSTRDSVRQMLADLRTEGPKAIGDLFKNLGNIGDQLFANVVTEKLFGGIFRDLKDQITGADKVTRAGDKIAAAVDKASAQIKSLGDAASGAANVIKGGPAAGVGAGADTASAAGQQDTKTDDITIVGKRLTDSFKSGYEGVFDGLNKQLKNTFQDIFGDRGIFSASMGKTLGTALGGAQLGGAVGKGVTDALGIKGSSTGAELGGAAGALLKGPLNSLLQGLGPFGSVIGGVLGSVIGGLFQSAPKAAAVITSASGDAQVTGNNADAKQAVSAAASGVQGAINQIVSALGGTAGNFDVSIGKWKDNYRVAPVATTKVSDKSWSWGSGASLLYDGTDEQAALEAAIREAIKDGAVQGISAAMQKALQSTSDVDKAVQEALKVQSVEAALGGIGYQLNKQFSDFETQAKERVRIAQQYGFDVLAVEKKNAEDRAALVSQILSQSVGSLQTLLSDLTTGDLSEGSAVDKRNALLAQIAGVQSDAMAGKDGAANQLADLERQLVQFTRDQFGTAGPEYAADRSGAVSAAEQVINAENDRIKAAQDATQATNDKLDTANSIANEQANYLAQIAQTQAAMLAAMQSSGGGGSNSSLSALYRYQNLK